jgi:hypothetical protein
MSDPCEPNQPRTPDKMMTGEGLQQWANNEQSYTIGCHQTAQFALTIVRGAGSLQGAVDLLERAVEELGRVRFHQAPGSGVLLDTIAERIRAQKA